MADCMKNASEALHQLLWKVWDGSWQREKFRQNPSRHSG